MEEVKVTENIPDDCVEIIFDFCKAFNGAQKKHNVFLSLEESCNFSFDFQGRKFVCNKTYGSKDENSKMCIMDVSQDDYLDDENVEIEKIEQDEVIEFDNDEGELNEDIKDKNKDNKVNGEKSDVQDDIYNISDDDNHINDINIKNNKTKNNSFNNIEEQQNNTALISKQGNSIGSNDYLFVRYNTIFLAKENNDKKFDVYCFFLGNLCNAKIKENDYVKSNTVKVASNIEKEKIQTFFKNAMVSNVVDIVDMILFSDKPVALKKFFNANTYSKEEINKINQEANSNLCKINCCGLC